MNIAVPDLIVIIGFFSVVIGLGIWKSRRSPDHKEDSSACRHAEDQLLIALACHGLGDSEGAKCALDESLAFTNTDSHATELAETIVRNRQAPRSGCGTDVRVR